MNNKLKQFLVELVIEGIKNETDPMAEQEFDFELGMRPHILGKKLTRDRKRNLVVQVIIESIDERFATKLMREEIFEVANAVLNSVEGLNVKVKMSRKLITSEDL